MKHKYKVTVESEETNSMVYYGYYEEDAKECFCRASKELRKKGDTVKLSVQTVSDWNLIAINRLKANQG